MQNISVQGILASTVIASVEIDLELPRGFVAKIHKCIVRTINFYDKLVAADQVMARYWLGLDPDDALTIQFPLNTVEHDGVLHGGFEYLGLGTGEWGMFEPLRHVYDFSHLEGLDIISARNMRFNTIANNDNADDAIIEIVIYYTLEEIKDNQIMELLDIL